MCISILDSIVALAESVPKLDESIPQHGNDLTIVCREGNAQNVFRVSSEAAGRGTGVEIPQTKLSIPAAWKSKLPIGRDGNILYEVAMTCETFLRIAIAFVTGEGPDNKRLVSRSRDDHVRVDDGAGDGGDPVAVAVESGSKG